eukprot:13606345-Alexandrium_andersonii.AAC.1
MRATNNAPPPPHSARQPAAKDSSQKKSRQGRSYRARKTNQGRHLQLAHKGVGFASTHHHANLTMDA